MEKYEKLFKGLAMCAGPECSTECPYYGETRGGKTCRAWLLNDAAAALAIEETAHKQAEITCEALRTAKNELDVELHRTQQREAALLNGEAGSPVKSPDEVRPAFDDDRPVKPKKPEPGLAETMECALKATMQAEYWRGQAEALKDFLRFYCGGQTVEDVHIDLTGMRGEPEPGAEGDV